jgi:hypothetical protein
MKTNETDFSIHLCNSNHVEKEPYICINVKDVKYTKAYGLYITINAGFSSMIDDVMLSDAETKVPICINYYGKEKYFTMPEFVEKLGLDT